MLIEKIVIGDRVRKDMGDIKSLAESMKRHGLLHPVVVKNDNSLVAGYRRIEAACLIGWKEIPVTVIDVADLLSAERDENAERKDFTPTEAVAIGRLIEEQHRSKIEAQEHEQKIKASKMGVAARLGTSVLKQDAGPGPLGRTVNIASKAVGMGASKYNKAKAIVTAAESDPEKFGDLPEQMDMTGNVSGAHREMERRKGGKNGKNKRHPVHDHTHYPKPNREMSRAITTLDAICDCLEALKPQELDAAKRAGWAKALSKFASRINRVSKRIK